MADLVTLVLPPGPHDFPIAHGAVDFKPYRADIGDPRSLWLVDVPAESAQYFIHNGGFYMPEEVKDNPDVPAGMARVRMKDGSGGGCGYAGVAYEADSNGVVLVPASAVAELCESHGFEAVPDEPPTKEADHPPTVRRVPRG